MNESNNVLSNFNFHLNNTDNEIINDSNKSNSAESDDSEVFQVFVFYLI